LWRCAVYLNAATDRAGLLEERGRDIFAFWHPTFEEFLAAVELATPTAKAIDRLLPLRNDPRWREVILLAVGYIGMINKDPDTATAIVEAILDREHGPLEPLLHSDLRLAANCISDDVGVKRAAAQRVIRELAVLIQEKPYRQFTEVFNRTVRGVSRLRPTSETVAALTPLAKHGYWDVLMEVTRLFSNVAADNDEARRQCESLLNDLGSYIKCHAALGLARAADFRPKVWQALSLFRSEAAQIESAAQDFFSFITEGAIKSLTDLLTAEDPGLRYNAASLLKDLGRADEQVINALLSWLTAEKPWPDIEAASLLKDLGRADEQVINALVSWLTAEDPGLRIEAAKLLKDLGRADEQVINAIVSWLTAEDPGLRYDAASLLKELMESDDSLVETVLGKAQAQSSEAIAACRRVMSKQALDESDEKALADLAQPRPEDTNEQRGARAALFGWLWEKLEPKERRAE